MCDLPTYRLAECCAGKICSMCVADMEVDAERRIVEWHRAEEAKYDAILSAGGLTGEEWARINERRTEHRVSARMIERGEHRG